jgi:E3 ubiquitin-protein ligase HUWE1
MYENYTAGTQVIKWFWELCAELDQSQKANLLQFVTGTSKVPLGGFKELRGINN